MIHHIRNFYRRVFAGLMLLTLEMLLSVVLFLVAFSVFIFVVRYIFIDNKHAFDSWAFSFAGRFVSEKSTDILLFFTMLGNSQFLLPANVLMTCYFLFIQKHKWYSIKIPSIALSSVCIMFLLKSLFNRSRPLIPLLEPARGLSFPSGHAMSSVTFYGLLIYFIWNSKWNIYLRILLIVTLVCVILMIGFSRIYLRVHYASDVIGGYCAGIIWLTISIFVIRKLEEMSKKELDTAVEKA